ncbi:hypothetical protein DAI22_07g164750 [Oryza sativa Japonica Group]|nr:hypothetical protein DAI22_07g164750 [Oryza sativa Japonica Group]
MVSPRRFVLRHDAIHCLPKDIHMVISRGWGWGAHFVEQVDGTPHLEEKRSPQASKAQHCCTHARTRTDVGAPKPPPMSHHGEAPVFQFPSALPLLHTPPPPPPPPHLVRSSRLQIGTEERGVFAQRVMGFASG